MNFINNDADNHTGHLPRGAQPAIVKDSLLLLNVSKFNLFVEKLKRLRAPVGAERQNR
jgi:hypothetical protein